VSFDDLVAHLDPRPDLRGREFERICKWFLGNAPEYRAQLRHVWLWDEWPGRWAADAGIDLVAETVDGELWAIQAKAYDAAYAIKKADVDSFLSESARPEFAYRLLIATTDRIGQTARRTLAGQEKPAGVLLRSQLALAEVRWPASPADLRPRPPRRKRPRPHQRKAVAAVVRGFDSSDRGQLVMACGTGKTLAACFLTEALAARRVLVLVPSLSLLAQTLREWALAAEFSYLAVCSDETVATVEQDAVVASTSELGIPVTTEPERIARFLRQRGDGLRVVFATYQSSPRIAEAQASRTPVFDLVIADEAHRCAGPEASVFATVLDQTRIKARKRLFMTATPRYFTGRVRKEASEADWEIASMGDEQKFGSVLHRLSFSEAIEHDLLSDYQVVVVGVTGQSYREMAERGAFVTTDGETITDARTLARQIGLLRAMRKHNLHRVVSFHSRISNARRFATSILDVSDWLPHDLAPDGNLWAQHVSGDMSSGERDLRLNRLRAVADDERGLLTNARCLSEGVDVPTLDGIAFIDPRRSQVDIVQAVGRAIRTADKKTVGTIVIPVFVDDDGDPEDALDSSEFDRVWQVVRALRDHDEALAEELDECRRELGRRGSLGEKPNKIVIELPSSVGVEFARAFDTRLIAKSTRRWEEAIGAAQAYRSHLGHLRVPLDFVTQDGFRLGIWIDGRRQNRRRGVLSPERVAELDALGMVWEPHEAAWERGLAAARAYREANGHLRAVWTYVAPDGFPLGAWLGNARMTRSEGTLTAERIDTLEKLGIEWDVFDETWRRGIAAVHAFREANGHLYVTTKYETPDGFRLGGWLVDKRAKHRLGKLGPERVAELDALGMVWEPHEAAWERGLAAAREYHAVHRHLDVPQAFRTRDGFALANWMTNQRSFRSRGSLSPERIADLDALGIVWDRLNEDWQRGLSAARAYHATYGDLSVPGKFVAEDGFRLGAWIQRRRTDRQTGRLSAERIAQLDALGMVWKVEVDGFATGHAAARDYRDAIGHLRVPQRHITLDGFHLGAWISKCRADRRRGKLSTDRTAALDALGMVWDTALANWERGVAACVAFRREYGHLRVPTSFITDDGFCLGTWLNSRRQEMKRGHLSTERMRELDALGVIWTPITTKWDRDLEAARAYRDAHGHLRVPTNFVTDDGVRLGAWINRRRGDRQRGRLAPERVAQLDALGMVWDAREDEWERALSAARAFLATHGHLLVPQRFTTEEGLRLGSWINHRREERKHGTLSQEKICELDTLGMMWESEQRSAVASS
jgi:superfamily II DNA or RNA helicase